MSDARFNKKSVRNFCRLRILGLWNLTAVLACSSMVFGQTVDKCAAVLAPSVAATVPSITDSTFASDIRKWACKQPNYSKDATSVSSDSAGLPLDDIPAQFGGTLTGAKASMWFESNCRQHGEPFTDSQAQRIAAVLVPADVIEAWKKCRVHEVDSQKAPQRVKISGILSGDKKVTLTLQWIPDPTSPIAPIVSEFVAFNAECRDVPKRDYVLNGSTTVECTRLGRSTMVFFLNTENQGSSNSLSFPPQPSLPHE